MTYASDIITDYFRQTGQPGDGALDAVFAFERSLLRDMLGRLEVILRDEGFDQAVAGRVIRCMLYGSPSPAVAELRMREFERTVKLMERLPPLPVQVTSGGGASGPSLRCRHGGAVHDVTCYQ